MLFAGLFEGFGFLLFLLFLTLWGTSSATLTLLVAPVLLLVADALVLMP